MSYIRLLSIVCKSSLSYVAVFWYIWPQVIWTVAISWSLLSKPFISLTSTLLLSCYLNHFKKKKKKKKEFCRPVYYYVFAVFTTLFYSKLRPTFEPDYSTLEQTSFFSKFVCTERDIPWLITPRDIIFNPLDISSRT